MAFKLSMMVDLSMAYDVHACFNDLDLDAKPQWLGKTFIWFDHFLSFDLGFAVQTQDQHARMDINLKAHVTHSNCETVSQKGIKAHKRLKMNAF